MCGIAGLVSQNLKPQSGDYHWFAAIEAQIVPLPLGDSSAGELQSALDALEHHFSDLMSLGFLRAIALDAQLENRVRALGAAFGNHEKALLALSHDGRTDLDPVIERLRDYGWQLVAETADLAKAATALIHDSAISPDNTAINVAIASEYVLRSIDKLEVRGRDSAGIAIQIEVPAGAQKNPDLHEREHKIHGDHLSVYRQNSEDGGTTLTFIYKTANLVGRLGDNGAALRKAISGDVAFWALAASAASVNILSHTRWASHGVISVANCHPHNASLTGDMIDANCELPLGAMYALNGDVDNHLELLAEFVTGHQMSVDPSITTDAKIIPLTDRLSETGNGDRLDAFRIAIKRLDGSVAIGCIDPLHPGTAFVSQKGSGQGLHAARMTDGWIFASEVYGLCNAARQSYNLARSVAGGTVIKLDAGEDLPIARTVNDGLPATINPEPIQIFARDIFRGDFDYFLEKEIHDGPESVAKTLRGRYRVQQDGLVAFDMLPTDIWANMRHAIKRGIARIYVIGQGTAGVAAVGIGELIERAIGRDSKRRIPVESVRSSELSADIESYDFQNALVIAVSQSGTTTDTNRAVDLARERGAFVHAIVNRRNSDLVRKSDSVLYTSDGRDVEMSVASTKAFYSQITAGKLTALFIADQLETMTDVELAYEMGELEKLPGHVQQVLDNEAHIAECARALAPYSRYWAVTGSGINHIAALEIRIKLSELCYKSIPVDFTEDKKHIDLSTEPLTLVIANDLPGDLVGDVVKEAAIFKAHNGKPIVFATQGDDAAAFADYAERVIALPKIGGDLAFVLATVAGHLFGFHAARAIDIGAQKLKTIVAQIDLLAMGDSNADLGATLAAMNSFVDEGADGAFNSGLSASDLAQVSRAARLLGSAGDADALQEVARACIEPIRHAFEETSRPVDTIRHQAKTVTVGTSRPEDALSPTVRGAMSELGIADSRMSFDERKKLAVVSRLVDQIRWSGVVAITTAKNRPATAKLEKQIGLNAPISQYEEAQRALGVLGAAVDSSELECGFIGSDPVIIVPITGDDYAQVEKLVCLGVDLSAHASREQKISVMNALGTYKAKLREWEQTLGAEAEDALNRQIARETPLTIVFRPAALDAMVPEADGRQSA